MTNLEALRADMLYPIADVKIGKALIDRGISPTGEYSLSVKSEVELSRADLYTKLLTAPNISEGGVSISISDKQTVMKVAASIYLKYGEPDPFGIMPTVSGASPW